MKRKKEVCLLCCPFPPANSIIPAGDGALTGRGRAGDHPALQEHQGSSSQSRQFQAKLAAVIRCAVWLNGWPSLSFAPRLLLEVDGLTRDTTDDLADVAALQGDLKGRTQASIMAFQVEFGLASLWSVTAGEGIRIAEASLQSHSRIAAQLVRVEPGRGKIQY